MTVLLTDPVVDPTIDLITDPTTDAITGSTPSWRYPM